MAALMAAAIKVCNIWLSAGVGMHGGTEHGSGRGEGISEPAYSSGRTAA